MKHLWLKITLVVLVILAFVLGYFESQFQPATEFSWGLNFSPYRVLELGMNVDEVYLNMLTDLKPAKIRLPLYWPDIEPTPGKFDFTEMDKMLTQAATYHTEVILVVGKKQPRWPECFHPDWAAALPEDQQNQAVLAMIKEAVNHFKSFPAVTIWQVENEPEFKFGDDCPKIPREILKQEIALVKSLDTRPVLVTDSGELGRWLPAATTGGDYFGTTMYRVVHNKYTGYFKYPLPPAFFRIKAGILNKFVHPKQILGVELQAEPWVINGINNADFKTQMALMNPKIFQENIDYAKAAGFHDNYLWGVEWWYWLTKQHQDYGMWSKAKDLLRVTQP